MVDSLLIVSVISCRLLQMSNSYIIKVARPRPTCVCSRARACVRACSPQNKRLNKVVVAIEMSGGVYIVYFFASAALVGRAAMLQNGCRLLIVPFYTLCDCNPYFCGSVTSPVVQLERFGDSAAALQ